MSWQEWSYGKNRMLSTMERNSSPKKIKTWKYYFCCCQPKYKKYPDNHTLTDAIIESNNDEYQINNVTHNSDSDLDIYDTRENPIKTWINNPGIK